MKPKDAAVAAQLVEPYWGGGITVTYDADPGLEVGEVVWLEQKEATLLRPEFRRRAGVISKTDLLAQHSVRYEFRSVPPAPSWSQRPDTARTIKI